jgi:hypothetical protein
LETGQFVVCGNARDRRPLDGRGRHRSQSLSDHLACERRCGPAADRQLGAELHQLAYVVWPIVGEQRGNELRIERWHVRREHAGEDRQDVFASLAQRDALRRALGVGVAGVDLILSGKRSWGWNSREEIAGAVGIAA